MISNTSTLPDNPEELKKLIEQMQSSHVAELEKLKGRHEAEVRLLQEQVRHLYNKLFGRKSEKSRYGEQSPQLCLFDMPEPDPDTEEKSAVEVKPHTRVRGKRMPVNDNLKMTTCDHLKLTTLN